MSAGRFKSKDDYFTHKSGLAERVISVRPQKVRRRSVESIVPSTLLRVLFCKTVDEFEIEGKGRFKKGEFPLDDALESHLEGDATVLVNPISHAGETAFSVVRFDLSEKMDHPFSCARRFADELGAHSIPCLIEVTEGGKGHYHLWIFHEEPVSAWRFSEALMQLGRELFNMLLQTVPSVQGDEYIPLPLQGESLLLQRRVFVNAVGKMIRDQGNVLRTLEYCPRRTSEIFMERMKKLASKSSHDLISQTGRTLQTPREQALVSGVVVQKQQPVNKAIPHEQPSPARPAAVLTEVSPQPEEPFVTVESRELIHSSAPSPQKEDHKAVEEKVIVEKIPVEMDDVHAEPVTQMGSQPDIPESAADDHAPKTEAADMTVVTHAAEKGTGDLADKTQLSNDILKKILVFERAGIEWGIPNESVNRIISLGKGYPRGSVVPFTMHLEEGSVTLVDTVGKDGDTVKETGAPRYAMILSGTYSGYALAADRMKGMGDYRPCVDVDNGKKRIAFKSDDGTRQVPSPDMESLTDKYDIPGEIPHISPLSDAPAGMYLVLSSRGVSYAIASDKVHSVLPGDARAAAEIIDPAGFFKTATTVIERSKGASGPKHHRHILVKARKGLLTVAAEHIKGLMKLCAIRQEDAYGYSCQPHCMTARAADGGAIFIFDPDTH